MKTKQIGLIALLAIITLALIACKEDEPDPKCECPNGTIHLVGETCCEGVNCNCEKNVVGQRVGGIPVTSRGGDHTKAIANVTTAFGYFTEEELTIIKNNVSEIKVTGSGVNVATFSKVNGKYVIEIKDSSAYDGIGFAFLDIINEISGS